MAVGPGLLVGPEVGSLEGLDDGTGVATTYISRNQWPEVCVNVVPATLPVPTSVTYVPGTGSFAAPHESVGTDDPVGVGVVLGVAVIPAVGAAVGCAGALEAPVCTPLIGGMVPGGVFVAVGPFGPQPTTANAMPAATEANAEMRCFTFYTQRSA